MNPSWLTFITLVGLLTLILLQAAGSAGLNWVCLTHA
jgi:hypothetical protein